MSWRRLLVYGALLVFVIDRVVGGVSGWIYGHLPESNAPATTYAVLTFYMAIFFGIPLLFAVGVWISRRSMTLSLAGGALTSASAALVGVSVSFFFSMAIVLSGLDLGVAGQTLDRVRDSWADALSTMGVVVAVSVVGGYLYGRRSTTAAYMDYLLRRVPDGTSEAIVSLAYEEARKHES